MSAAKFMPPTPREMAFIEGERIPGHGVVVHRDVKPENVIKSEDVIEPEPLVAPHSRLSVDIPSETLRRLKIRAIERRQTVRDYVLALLVKDGLPG